MKPRILSISYDLTLLRTREMMLSQAGYEAVSAEGFTAALEHCSGTFDLIILGHSIPQKDKRVIVAELHDRGCDAPLLSLLRTGEQPIPEATVGVDPSNPQQLLDAVDSILRKGIAKIA